jgi:hypothetical protein
MHKYSVLAVASSNVSTTDILRTITLTAFSGYTSFIGKYLSKRIKLITLGY